MTRVLYFVKSVFLWWSLHSWWRGLFALRWLTRLGKSSAVGGEGLYVFRSVCERSLRGFEPVYWTWRCSWSLSLFLLIVRGRIYNGIIVGRILHSGSSTVRRVHRTWQWVYSHNVLKLNDILAHGFCGVFAFRHNRRSFATSRAHSQNICSRDTDSTIHKFFRVILTLSEENSSTCASICKDCVVINLLTIRQPNLLLHP